MAPLFYEANGKGAKSHPQGRGLYHLFQPHVVVGSRTRSLAYSPRNPLDRGKADVRAIRRSLKILKEAEVLGVFPEGTRNHNSNELARLHGGAAMLALRGEVPIVPIAIRGKYGLGSAVKVSIGEPFRLTAASGRFSSAVAEGSRRIAHEITELWKATDGEGA